MPWVNGAGAVPPSFELDTKLGGTWRAGDFGAVLDKLAQPQGQSGPEFPDIERPALTLDAARVRVGPQSPGQFADAGHLFRPLADFVGQVNAQANAAADMQEAFAAGEDVELHDVMIAGEKATLGVQLATQIRNRFLEAYQEIWRMQV